MVGPTDDLPAPAGVSIVSKDELYGCRGETLMFGHSGGLLPTDLAPVVMDVVSAPFKAGC